MKLNIFFDLILKLILNLKYVLIVFFLLFLLSVFYFGLFYEYYYIDLTPFLKYVSDCKNLIKYKREPIIDEHPYISVCIAAKNMENYIEKNLLSILSQSFQNFEIIVVNDGSEDQTENIINRMQSTEKRIKLLSHKKTLAYIDPELKLFLIQKVSIL